MCVGWKTGVGIGKNMGKGQDQKAETPESISEGIANSKWKKRLTNYQLQYLKQYFP